MKKKVSLEERLVKPTSSAVSTKILHSMINPPEPSEIIGLLASSVIGEQDDEKIEKLENELKNTINNFLVNNN